MKTITKFLLLFTLFLALPIYAVQELELSPASELIAWLTPIIVWGVTAVFNKLVKLPGWVILSAIIPVISLGVTWLTNQLEITGLNFWFQVLYGLLAVFLDQLKRKLQEKLATL